MKLLHVNSLFKSYKNGYPSQLDSFDDQLSILLGTLHANMHLYPFKTKLDETYQILHSSIFVNGFSVQFMHRFI